VRSWFAGLIRKRATDWYFVALEEHDEILPDKVYVSVFLRSMHILNVRTGLKRFAGAVHSFIELPQRGPGTAGFQTFTVPDQLKELDPKHIDRVVVSSQRLLGPVPYRGGDISLEMGLFSVETSDLVDAYLGILTDLANAAGVGYVNAALPFVKPIENGIQRLLGADGPAMLEIGVSKDLDTPRVGAYLVMRGPERDLAQIELVHDDEFRITRADRAELNYPYLTYEIVTTPIRSDWFKLDELRRAHATLQEVVRSGNVKGARDQFTAFRYATLTSPDLLYGDAQRIVEEVEKDLEGTLKTTATSSNTTIELSALESLRPFAES
jgi:hypothetical protein